MNKKKVIQANNQNNTQRVVRLSETHLMVYVDDNIDITHAPKLALLCEKIKHTFPELIEIIPSYTSIMIEFHPLHTQVAKLEVFLRSLLVEFEKLQPTLKQQLIQLPVYYHPDVAPDLEALAKTHEIDIADVIQIHSEMEYTVCAIGFAPGFAFLGAVDERIVTARHAEPRLNVVKGSVGIADQQTAVYPADSPGGWQIIGNCPIDLFNPAANPMTPFKVGDKVRFVPIDRERFIELGGIESANKNEQREAMTPSEQVKHEVKL
ncbi:5-oxoprolinase subunit PxpB [Vibrio rumoiensis]|uniref:Allophanate hydrolase n=1 Tax=Vibrio rumoiensis 1S-45 TaxID=1188252 RepID=A0A1E5E0D7_9VIBR|nr:5-oxoprolinase subunit PxpB [Vibrio rumoiensis]OEF23849.1 allophanate hydrolase [Vibrio rumoiensis 1S-45]